MGLVKSEKDLQTLRHTAREINSILFKFFAERNLKLVDFKVEFGIDKDGNIILADEISLIAADFGMRQQTKNLTKIDLDKTLVA